MTKDLQKIPTGWKKVKLGEVLKEVNERVGNKILEPIAIGIKGIRKRSEIYYKELAEDYSNNKVLRYGYLAFGLGTNEMAIGVNTKEVEYCVSPAYKVFSIINEDPKYFNYLSKLMQINLGDKFLIISARQGKNIDYKWFLEQYFLLPPLPEQEKIAEILETVDNTIEKTDAIIEKYKRIKQGLMQELLTKGIDGNWKIRSEKTHQFKDSPLGRIPSDWEVKNISEVTENVLNGTWGDEPDNSDNCYPVIRSTEINRYGIINLESAVIRKVDKKTVDKFTLRNLDILIVASSGSQDLIGRVALFKTTLDNSKFLFSNFMLRTRTTEILNPVFLYYFLNSDQYKNFLQTFQETTTGLRNFPKRDFLKFLLPRPPLPEQERIASVISQVDAVIEKETAYRDKLSRIKQGLMEDLLAGKVRVTTLLENNTYQKEAF